jgi:hypothetical protein
MAFSKLNFAAACLLLGTSGLLVSCNETKPSSTEGGAVVSSEPNSTNCVKTPECIKVEVPSTICKESDQSTRTPKESEEPNAGCIHQDLT